MVQDELEQVYERLKQQSKLFKTAFIGFIVIIVVITLAFAFELYSMQKSFDMYKEYITYCHELIGNDVEGLKYDVVQLEQQLLYLDEGAVYEYDN